jgi:hypothetical protein
LNANHLGFPMLLVITFAGLSCGEVADLHAADSGSPACEPGETQLCQCDGDWLGVQICDGNGQWGDCDCEGDNPNPDPCGDAILFVVDRSSSMDNEDKWDALTATFTDVLGTFGDAAVLGLEVFPDDSCDDEYEGQELSVICRGPDNLLVDIAGGTVQSIIDSITEVGTCGGTPTATALGKALSVVASTSAETRVVLVTDGTPNCNDEIQPDDCECPLEPPELCQGNPAACVDAVATSLAAIQLKEEGAPVHVIAWDTDPAWNQVFNQIAAAGGTSQAEFCDTAEDLASALTEILLSVTDC